MKPFKTYMNYNLQNSGCVIEFSSKILLDRYPELISKNNIYECFQNFKNIGFCDMDIDGIIHDSELLSCDITTDISGIAQPDRLAVKSCINNFDKFRVQKYRNSGLTVTKMVTTQNLKIRISLYDKGKELRKKKNTDFLGMLNDSDAVLAYFDGKFRVESNVTTKLQIRNLFQTETTNLLDVLHSKSNPLLFLFDEVFTLPEESDQPFQAMPSPLLHSKLSVVKNALLLEACEYDMEKVDNVLKNTLSPNTDKSKYRTKLIAMLNTFPQPNKNIETMKKIRLLIDKGISKGFMSIQDDESL